MKNLLLMLSLLIPGSLVSAQEAYPQAAIDFEAFAELTQKLKTIRPERLVTLEEFQEMSQEVNTIILDTRSAKAFEAVHMKGARNLDFSEITADKLAEVIPSKSTRILIYCNNNFDLLKSPVKLNIDQFLVRKGPPIPEVLLREKENTFSDGGMALNIPTFITLYGYGYRNVYELSSLITMPDEQVLLEGSTIVEQQDEIQPIANKR